MKVTRKPSLEVAPTTLATFFLPWPWTVISVKLDLRSVTVNQRAKYLGRRSISSKIIVRTGHTDMSDTRPMAPPGPLKCSVKIILNEREHNSVRRAEIDRQTERERKDREAERWTCDSDVEITKLGSWCVDGERRLLSTLQQAESVSSRRHAVWIVHHECKRITCQYTYVHTHNTAVHGQHTTLCKHGPCPVSERLVKQKIFHLRAVQLIRMKRNFFA